MDWCKVKLYGCFAWRGFRNFREIFNISPLSKNSTSRSPPASPHWDFRHHLHHHSHPHQHFLCEITGQYRYKNTNVSNWKHTQGVSHNQLESTNQCTRLWINNEYPTGQLLATEADDIEDASDLSPRSLVPKVLIRQTCGASEWLYRYPITNQMSGKNQSVRKTNIVECASTDTQHSNNNQKKKEKKKRRELNRYFMCSITQRYRVTQRKHPEELCCNSQTLTTLRFTRN